MTKWRVIALLLLIGCSNESIQSRITDADRIEIVDLETKFSHTDSSQEVVKGFRELLDQKPEVTDCPVQGTVFFKKGDQVLLKAGYYKDATSCAFLTIEQNGQKTGYRLTPNTLVYLGLYFQKLKQLHNAGHH